MWKSRYKDEQIVGTLKVVRVLERLRIERGLPPRILIDNGTGSPPGACSMGPRKQGRATLHNARRSANLIV